MLGCKPVGLWVGTGAQNVRNICGSVETLCPYLFKRVKQHHSGGRWNEIDFFWIKNRVRVRQKAVFWFRIGVRVRSKAVGDGRVLRHLKILSTSCPRNVFVRCELTHVLWCRTVPPTSTPWASCPRKCAGKFRLCLNVSLSIGDAAVLHTHVSSKRSCVNLISQDLSGACGEKRVLAWYIVSAHGEGCCATAQQDLYKLKVVNLHDAPIPHIYFIGMFVPSFVHDHLPVIVCFNWVLLSSLTTFRSAKFACCFCWILSTCIFDCTPHHLGPVQ